MTALAADRFVPFRPQTITPPARAHGAIGAVLTLIDNPLRIWPEAMYRERVHIGSLGRVRFVNLASPGLAQSLLVEHADAFVRGRVAQRLVQPALRDGLLTSEGEAWRRQRRIAAPAFRVQALRALTPVMAEAGRRVAERLAARPGLVDVAPAMTEATFDVIVGTLLRLDPSADLDAVAADMGAYIENVGKPDLFDLFDAPDWLPRPWKRRGMAAVERLREAAAASLRTAPRPGAAPTLTDLLIAAADPETGAGMTERELVDNVLTFIAAGHETTALALTWTLYCLSQAPELQDALAEEVGRVAGDAPIEAAHVDALTLHEAVVGEAIRLYPPAAVIPRTAIRDVTLSDAEGALEIREGDAVAVAIYPMHRHHALWDAPDSFRLGRKPAHRFAYMPFGAGPRICIGLKFAMIEAVAILAEITRRLRVAPGPAREIEPVLRITLRPKGGMPLGVRPR